MQKIIKNMVSLQPRGWIPNSRGLWACGLLLAVAACSSVSDDFANPLSRLPDPIDEWQYRTVAELPGISESEAPPVYHIGPRDELTVTLWGYPDLGSQVPVEGDSRRNISIVQENGTVSLPFLGNVDVAGLTVEEVRRKVERLYRRTVSGAQADVVVTSYLSKAVLLEGEFKKTGRLFLSDRLRTLGDAVATAEGFTAEADPGRGILVRGRTEYHFDYWGTRGGPKVDDVLLMNGDRIYVPSINDQQVYIFGEVLRQGVFRIPPSGLNLVQALASSGGPDVVTADLNEIFLVRQSGDGAKVYRFSLAQALEAPEIALQNNDRLLVDATGLAKWDRFWRQALPFFSSTNAATNTAVKAQDNF